MSQENVERSSSNHEITIEANDEASISQENDDWRAKIKSLIKKYFWNGQEIKLPDGLPPVAREILTKNFTLRETLLSFSFGILLINFLWWTLAVKNNYFPLFISRYKMSIATIFMSLLGGATSEGSGLFNYPLMTLALNIAPNTARDFSLLLQSSEMVISSTSVLWKRLEIDWNSVLFACTGGFFGILFGFEILDNYLQPDMKQLLFICTWFTFGFAIFFINSESNHQYFEPFREIGSCQRLWVALAGVGGGLLTSLYGCGANIFVFAVLSLLFRVRQNVVLPTSIIIMTFNSLFGFYWREFISGNGMSEDAWFYFAATLPIASLAAPLGSFLAEHIHRHIIAVVGFTMKSIGLASTLCLTPMNTESGILVGNLVCTGFVFYFILLILGRRRLLQTKNDDEESLEDESDSETADHPEIIIVR